MLLTLNNNGIKSDKQHWVSNPSSIGCSTTCWEDSPLAELPGPAERKLRLTYSPELVHSDLHLWRLWGKSSIRGHQKLQVNRHGRQCISKIFKAALFSITATNVFYDIRFLGIRSKASHEKPQHYNIYQVLLRRPDRRTSWFLPTPDWHSKLFQRLRRP